MYNQGPLTCLTFVTVELGQLVGMRQRPLDWQTGMCNQCNTSWMAGWYVHRPLVGVLTDVRPLNGRLACAATPYFRQAD
jgi:hypothetical protein